MQKAKYVSETIYWDKFLWGIPMKKIARRNFLKLVGVSASIPILQSLPIASASATDLSDYPLLKDGIFDFENTDITQYVWWCSRSLWLGKRYDWGDASSGELTPQDLKQHLLELAEQPKFRTGWARILWIANCDNWRVRWHRRRIWLICMRQMKEPVLQDPVANSQVPLWSCRKWVVGRR